MSIDKRHSVSVVVLSKDEPELDKTLKLLKPQIEAMLGECVVVDASEGRLEWIRLEHPWVKWVQYQRPIHLNVTIPQQRNVGVRASSGTLVAFCDAGGAPSEKWLELLCAPLIAGEYEVSCGPVRSTAASVYQVINDLTDGSVVESVLTANLAFTREAFDAVNGFDERYEYGSDADFAWRLLDAGKPPRSVRAAEMGMNWGEWSLQKKRSWRYGKARARLFYIHKSRRACILWRSPEIVVYPAWVASVPASIFISYASRSAWAFTLPVAVLSLLLWRNRKSAKPVGVVLDHLIYSASFVVELFRFPLRELRTRSAYVIHTPNDPGPYQPFLLASLGVVGVRAGFVEEPTKSNTVNLLLLPLTILRARLFGARVVHIHWAHDFDLPWARGRQVSAWLIQKWFGLWLSWTRMIGLRIVWTAHNTFPHSPIFSDEVAARKTLISAADAVIAHSEYGSAKLAENFGSAATHIIPQGSTPPPTLLSNDEARELLGLPVEGFVATLVGRLERYKGISEFLGELLEREPGELSGMTIVIAGACSDQALRSELDALAWACVSEGIDVRLRVWALSEDEFWGELAAADVALFPFTSITNSGSLVAALSAGTPALVSDLPAFAAVATEAVEIAVGGVSAFVDALKRAQNWSDSERIRRAAAAVRWSSENTWERTALATRKVYEEVSRRGGKR